MQALNYRGRTRLGSRTERHYWLLAIVLSLLVHLAALHGFAWRLEPTTSRPGASDLVSVRISGPNLEGSPESAAASERAPVSQEVAQAPAALNSEPASERASAPPAPEAAPSTSLPSPALPLDPAVASTALNEDQPGEQAPNAPEEPHPEEPHRGHRTTEQRSPARVSEPSAADRTSVGASSTSLAATANQIGPPLPRPRPAKLLRPTTPRAAERTPAKTRVAERKRTTAQTPTTEAATSSARPPPPPALAGRIPQTDHADSTPEPSPPGGTSASPGAVSSALVAATPRPPDPSEADAKAAYLEKLSALVRERKRYPRLARRRGQEGTAMLEFRLARDGRLLGQALRRSSGHRLLDEEAIAMIQRAAPLPAPPPTVGGDELQFVIPVTFSLR